jgi:hypothetical protein
VVSKLALAGAGWMAEALDGRLRRCAPLESTAAGWLLLAAGESRFRQAVSIELSAACWQRTTSVDLYS